MTNTTVRISEEKMMQIVNLYNDIDFKNAAKDLQSVDQLQALLNSFGVKMTLEETDEFCRALAENYDPDRNELTEDELEDVSGGVSLTAILVVGGIIILGAFILGVYHARKDRNR